MRWKFIYFSWIICLFACNIRKAINPTAREKYERSFKGPDSLLKEWQQAYVNALKKPVTVDLPLVLTARLHDSMPAVICYRFPVNQGQVIVAELDKQQDSTQFFMELFKPGDSGKLTVAKETESMSTLIETVITETDTLMLIIQPAIHNHSLFRLRIYLQAAYLFPVAGKSNNAITSLWGAARDGGVRTHEGIDIVAKRGTPLLAVADGYITSTGNRGLGGKQVWMRDAVLKKSIYYAHLDSIAIQDGKNVKRGDTLGFVGNTGNAITTIPHLHFGVYSSDGATDPLPFVKQLPIPEFTDDKLIRKAITRNNKNELRTGPALNYPVLHSFSENQVLIVLGKINNWYYVQSGSYRGFISQTSVKVAS